MYRVLVVDDEKIEREGIKFLLSREEGEFEISEEGKREKRGAADRDL